MEIVCKRSILAGETLVVNNVHITHIMGAGVDSAAPLADELLVDDSGRVQGDAAFREQHKFLIDRALQRGLQQLLCGIH